MKDSFISALHQKSKQNPLTIKKDNLVIVNHHLNIYYKTRLHISLVKKKKASYNCLITTRLLKKLPSNKKGSFLTTNPVIIICLLNNKPDLD